MNWEGAAVVLRCIHAPIVWAGGVDSLQRPLPARRSNRDLRPFPLRGHRRTVAGREPIIGAQRKRCLARGLGGRADVEVEYEAGTTR